MTEHSFPTLPKTFPLTSPVNPCSVWGMYHFVVEGAAKVHYDVRSAFEAAHGAQVFVVLAATGSHFRVVRP